MSDPTELTLWLSFLFALGLFAVTSYARYLTKRGQNADLAGSTTVSEQEADISLALPATEELIEDPYISPLKEDSPEPAEKVPSHFYRPLDFLWMGFIFCIFCLLSVSTARATGNSHGAKIDIPTILISCGFQLFLATVTTFMVFPRMRPTRWLGLRWAHWPMVFLIAPFTVGVLLVLTYILQVAGYQQWMEQLHVQQTQETVKMLQNSDDTVALALMALTAVFVAPVCEELVFRGYLYPAAKRFAGRWVAGFCVALVFAAAHGSLAALAPLFLVGVALVVVYETTGSIWAPMATHMCFNALTVIAQIALRYFHIDLPK
ncbi:CPBP family intramembrane metalloprotease [Luteolibacter pohnpeiensis]|uniref:CPBP family intramembrane metalloprotease n=1 Tax=Luteolibacter pohnpeiensis TaxID=454153 RepID=A0A934S8V2_9BACT|nr:type II CAAX endopeptidase family protein [Luteolibacter pohnpeiensis]MBK1881817.1 CPBP family intramembrane metalloprotease [Luteolibacter pohnpeiensis]